MTGGTLSDAPWVEGHETKWKHQEAYNILWTYEELSAFADDHNTCYRAWLGKVASRALGLVPPWGSFAGVWEQLLAVEEWLEELVLLPT